jgi:replicative DNA helicase
VNFDKLTENDQWYTPPVYIDAARQIMGGIDLDPASNELAQKTIRAEVFYSAEDDGLAT